MNASNRVSGCSWMVKSMQAFKGGTGVKRGRKGGGEE